MLSLQQKITLLCIVATIGGSNAFSMQNETDGNFTEWLSEKMAQYGKWNQDNGLDPSPPLSDVITLSIDDFSRVSLKCNISNQVIRNHSLTTGDVVLVEGSISKQFAVIGREVHQAYVLEGSYACTGTIHAGSVENSTLPFNGNGTFSFVVSYSDEMAELTGFEITEEGEFDVAHSSINYAYFPNLGQVDFVGVWAPEEVANYRYAVLTAFKTVYYEHLTRDARPQAPINPSRVLLERYMLEIFEEANLADIIDG